jgi:hypothetical protein
VESRSPQADRADGDKGDKPLSKALSIQEQLAQRLMKTKSGLSAEDIAKRKAAENQRKYNENQNRQGGNMQGNMHQGILLVF